MNERKTMIVEKDNTPSLSNSSSNNSSNTDDEIQCLVAREINNCMVGIDNGLDEPEITSGLFIKNLSHTIVLPE